jgi:hypothetical protein
MKHVVDLECRADELRTFKSHQLITFFVKTNIHSWGEFHLSFALSTLAWSFYGHYSTVTLYARWWSWCRCKKMTGEAKLSLIRQCTRSSRCHTIHTLDATFTYHPRTKQSMGGTCANNCLAFSQFYFSDLNKVVFFYPIPGNTDLV